MSVGILIVTMRGEGNEGMLLTSCGWRPGRVLNILQFKGQPPQQSIIQPQNVTSAEVEEPCSSHAELRLFEVTSLEKLRLPERAVFSSGKTSLTLRLS